jgi:hypothetical protein
MVEALGVSLEVGQAVDHLGLNPVLRYQIGD